jgi:hypothetical protein
MYIATLNLDKLYIGQFLKKKFFLKSEEYQLSLKKAEKEKFFKPPRLPPLTELFSNISHLLDSDVFIKMIICTLRRFNSKSKLASEGQLIRVRIAFHF